MSLPISPEDEQYLLAAIQQGSGLLVLGAGASHSSENAKGEPIRMSLGLAAKVAETAHLPYEGESLKEVLDAVIGDKLLNDVQLKRILRGEYHGCKPSSELCEILNYTWKALYTWNIDDAIQNINYRRVQSLNTYNGMTDKAVQSDSLTFLNVIYLHGQIDKEGSSFILTREDYNNAISSSWHFWYKQLAQDYMSACPIFIGSSLDEPILDAEVERAKKEFDSDVGRAFLIVPTKLSPIRTRSYRSRGIVHVPATLKEFMEWLRQNMPEGLTPKDVLAKKTAYSHDVLDGLTRDDFDIAQSIRLIDPRALMEANTRHSETQEAVVARRFLTGFPPTWEIASSAIPVELETTKQLYNVVKVALSEACKLIVVTGQAGGGKTTGVMSAILKYAKEYPDTSIFELSPDVKSVQRAFRLINRIRTGHALVHVRDIFVFGDSFRDDVYAIEGGGVTVITTARTGEWREHLERHYGGFSKTFIFERFSRKDYDPLIDRILKYVPAPLFKLKNTEGRYASLNRSKSQLLIALREATESDIFSDIITNEFEKLPDIDTQRLLLCVGIATLARVGIRQEIAQEVYEKLRPTRSYSKAMDALSGIVAPAYSGRLFARHELYVRHIIEKIASFDDIKIIIVEMLRTFVKYNIPVVKSVPRQDGAIFKFLLNHKFISENETRKAAAGDGIFIYEQFEVEFQLDGHFWLQYGLYLAGLGRTSDAIVMLDRSIKAYSGNPFAIHALADVQMKLAGSRDSYDSVTRDLLEKAVSSLRALDANLFLEIDEVPLVTQSIGHLEVLIRFNQNEDARRVAAEYFSKLQQMEKATGSKAVTRAKERVFRYATLGDWDEGRRRKRRRNSGRR